MPCLSMIQQLFIMTMDIQPPDKNAKKKARQFHALLVLVIFQSLVILALLIAVIYKFIEIGSSN